MGSAFLAVGLAYLGGILASLTPCIYPMIPITMGVIGGIPVSQAETAKQARADRLRALILRGFLYICGMAVTYSFMGVAAGLTGKVFGTITNTSEWYLGLGMIISLAALVMLDVIHFDPVSLWSRVKARFGGKRSPASAPALQREMTHLGVFALGASSGFIAAPCTTPVLTTILAFIANTQSVGLGMALMTSFSLGLGTILLLVAGFAGAIQVLPKSGQWMNTVKLVSGLILLAFGGYLIYQAGALGGIS